MLPGKTQFEIPRLSEGTQDVANWFKRYELAGKMHNWVKTEQGDPRLEYLEFFFDDSILIAYEELPIEKKSSYEDAKKVLISRFSRPPRASYADFITSRFDGSMKLDSFVDQLKRALLRAVPGLTPQLSEDLVLHQLLYSLPDDQRSQVLLTAEKEGEKLKLSAVMEKARAVTATLTRSIAPPPRVSAAMNSSTKESGTVDLSKVRCYNCNNYGHYATTCPQPAKKSKNSSKGAKTNRSH